MLKELCRIALWSSYEVLGGSMCSLVCEVNKTVVRVIDPECSCDEPCSYPCEYIDYSDGEY